MSNANGIPEFFKNFTPGDLVFDLGAHTGTYTDRYLALGARVVCVDPQPWCVEQLKLKYLSNPKVIIEPVGISDQPGHLPLMICEQFNTLSTFSIRWKNEGRFSSVGWGSTKLDVEVMTLDRLIEKHGKPFVYQERNQQDPLLNLEKELFGMTHTPRFCKDLWNIPIPADGDILSKFRRIIEGASRMDYLPEKTRVFLIQWIQDVEEVL
jgi:FkbM family methyltransferase